MLVVLRRKRAIEAISLPATTASELLHNTERWRRRSVLSCKRYSCTAMEGGSLQSFAVLDKIGKRRELSMKCGSRSCLSETQEYLGSSVGMPGNRRMDTGEV